MGCGSSEVAPDEVLPVRLHTLPRCDLPKALLQGRVELQALGDFPDSNDTAEVLPITEGGVPLRFPLTTRAIEARIGGPEARFIGFGERLARDQFDVVLWPALQHCPVFRPDGPQGYPGKNGGQALGYSQQHGVVFAAGGNDPLVSDAFVGALTFDVTTGAVTSFDTSQDTVLREARAFATVSELGDKLLVAGGQRPVFDVPEEDLDVRRTAEIFDPAQGAFVGELMQLENPRTKHAAVALDNGNTLLVGGRSRVGDSNVSALLAEVISSKTLEAKPTATLAERIEPRAVRLSDGRVFVGGGYTRITDKRMTEEAAKPAGEWLARDGGDVIAETERLPARFARAFVATPGGGVLAVGGCEDREADKSEGLDCNLACGVRGCPPAPSTDDPTGYDAWWLDRDGTEVHLRGALAAIVAPQPILLSGSDGSAWLIAARESDPYTPRLFRFNPWNQRFIEADIPASVRLPRPGFPAPVVIDPDAFVWIDDSGGHAELFGLRLGTRNRYTQDLALVLLSDPSDPSRPLHLVPDRPLSSERGELYDGRLWLEGPDEAAVTVSVADADYGDVTVRVRLAEPHDAQGIPPSVPPRIWLGDVELGGACAWPVGKTLLGDAAIPTLVRRGTQVELKYQGERASCSVPAGRLPLALRAGDGRSVIAELEVKRGAAERR